MEILTPIQKIDIVLDYFKANPHKIPFDSLLEEMKNKGIVTSYSHLRTIIDKLQYDRLIIDATIRGAEQEQLLITYEGLLFKGYQLTLSDEVSASELSAAERVRLRQIEQQGVDNAATLNRLTENLGKATWWAVGAAAALFLWDILRFLIERSC